MIGGESLRDVYNYGDIKGVYELQQYSDKITSKKSKFGNASLYLDTGYVLVDHLLDTTKGFTFSFWYYDALLLSNRELCNLNMEDGSLRPGISYGWFNSTYRRLCLSSKKTNTYDCEVRDVVVYPYTEDANSWVHIEFSFDASTKIFRIFRNGVVVYTNTLSFYIDNIGKNMIFNGGGVYYDEVLLINTCLHTAAFTPPTEPYVYHAAQGSFCNNLAYGYK